MPHPYDASAKYLVEVRLADWLPLCGRTTTARVTLVDTDVSTVSGASDRVLRVEEDPPWVLHVELQASRDRLLPARLPFYNTRIGDRHETPVHTMVVLLCRAADGPELDGAYQRSFPGQPPYLVFRYQVVRVWQLPVETFLSGGLGLVALAPLSAVSEAELPQVIQRMAERIRAEATREEAGNLWTAADVLMGLRYSAQMVAHLLRGVHEMKESATYQAIVEEGFQVGMQKGIQQGIEEGMLEEARRALIELGAERLGPPSDEVAAAIGQMAELERLRRLRRQVFRAATWEELLATPE